MFLLDIICVVSNLHFKLKESIGLRRVIDMNDHLGFGFPILFLIKIFEIYFLLW